MRKLVGGAFIALFILLILVVIYTFWDNNRIKVVKQEIEIEGLPEQLEGFSILQVTDLHEKQFGKEQKRLIETINEINYDAIVFTGDMLDGTDSSNYGPFYNILEGIGNKQHAWYVSGNADPDSYLVNDSLEKSEFVRGVEARGVQLLESMETVSVDGANIHFVNFELSIVKEPGGRVQGIVQPAYTSTPQYLDYQEQLIKQMKPLDHLRDSDILVALNHYPVVDARIDFIQSSSNNIWRNFDLIMAGHYHGGQIRLPLIGALFVPEAWYEPNGMLPPRNRVKGLWEYKQKKQYVSAGLGSSDAISLMKFRLFNTPEINLLKLTSK
ncbi:metallophosphoesterase [Sediminibacillus massiliensis]|uniref:metallophosphoesterase n=1 Tax=Sediminibacillus massiliensis TaxID=1926277 RepID=UPI0009885142|nr:metallophosphoesterase [Sediminibacillus massiliensis]